MIITENRLKLERTIHTTGEDIYTVEGYACHFGRPNLNGEIVEERSFKYFFETLAKRHIMPYFDYDHTGTIIGAWDEIKSDDNGLLVKGHIYKNIGFVRDQLVPLIDAGDLSYLSTFGFASDITHEKNGYFVGKFELLAISLVNMPADMRAYVDISSNGVKIERHEYHGEEIEQEPAAVETIEKVINNHNLLFV